MRKKQLYLLIILLVFLITNNACFFNSKKKPEMYVSTVAGLKLRNNPDTESQTLALIPYMDKVQVLEEKNEELYLSKKYGKWCQVSWNDKKGWVFSGFLSEFNVINLPETVSNYYREMYKDSKKFNCDNAQVKITSKEIQVVQIFEKYIILRIPLLHAVGGGCDDVIRNKPIIWIYDKSNNNFTKFYDIEDYINSLINVTDMEFAYLHDNNKPSLIITTVIDGGKYIHTISDVNNISLNENDAFYCNTDDSDSLEKPTFDKCDKTRIQCLNGSYKKKDEKIETYSYDCKTGKFYKIEK